MNKKVLSLVLALVIVLGTFGTVFAAGETIDAKVQWLIDNGIVAGRTVNADGSADLALDKTLTRAEVTKLIVYTLKLENLADILKGVIKAFPDVELTHWANGYISVATTQRADVAYGRRIIIGYPDDKFYPENNVTYGELAAMLVRIVKKDLTADMEKTAIWATSYVRWAQEEGILDGVVITDSNAPAIRRDAFAMIYNAMYKLGKTNYNSPQFGDVMGIVSKVQAGIVQLNQDPKMEYKITYNSRVTNGTTWADVAANAVRPGALVRLIADKDGNIEYLMELGNPVELAVGREANDNRKNDRWFDVADYTAEARANTYFKNSSNAREAIVVGGVEAKIMSNTRFFVADVANNALKEVKTINEVFNIYRLDDRNVADVYMGYNSYAGRNEAKVIVFGKVDKYQGGTELRRITSWVGGNYGFTAEDTKGVNTSYDVRNTNLFPISYDVERMDVVKLYLNYNSSLTSEATIQIDYSKDPVFVVHNLESGKRLVTLRDKFSYERQFYMPTDASVFTEGQFREGAHVQVKFANDYKEIEIISVVDKELKGALPTGVVVSNKGFFVRKDVLTPDGAAAQVVIAEERVKLADGTYDYRGQKLYTVATTDTFEFEGMTVGTEITFEITNILGSTPVIFNVKPYVTSDAPNPNDEAAAKDRVYKEAIRLRDLTATTDAEKEAKARAVSALYEAIKNVEARYGIVASSTAEPLMATAVAYNTAYTDVATIITNLGLPGASF